MLTEYGFKQGFGPRRIKEYFVVEKDGDTLGGVIAGPFQFYEQACDAMEALRPLYRRPLRCVGGHLVGWRDCAIPESVAYEPGLNPTDK